MPQPPDAVPEGGRTTKSLAATFSSWGGKPMGVEPTPSCEGERRTYSVTTGPCCRGPRSLLKVNDTNGPDMARVGTIATQTRL